MVAAPKTRWNTKAQGRGRGSRLRPIDTGVKKGCFRLVSGHVSHPLLQDETGNGCGKNEDPPGAVVFAIRIQRPVALGRGPKSARQPGPKARLSHKYATIACHPTVTRKIGEALRRKLLPGDFSHCILTSRLQVLLFAQCRHPLNEAGHQIAKRLDPGCDVLNDDAVFTNQVGNRSCFCLSSQIG